MPLLSDADALYFGTGAVTAVYSGSTSAWPAGFTPGSLDPFAWYQADAITGKTDGQAMSQWDDMSGNANHLVQATGSLQPLYKTAVQNGLPGVRFDGADDVMSASASASIQHVFVVAKYAAATFGSWAGLVSDTTTAVLLTAEDNSVNFYNDTPTTAYHKDGSLLAETAMVGPMDAWAVISCSSTGFTNPMTPQIGKDRGFADRTWDGDIGEVIWYETVLSAGDRQAVEAYLKAKWGTP